MGDRERVEALPWALMTVAGDGTAAANAKLLELLHTDSVASEALERRFEVSRLGGRALVECDLPWRRASRGEAFSEEETWYDRSTAERLLLQLRCHVSDGAALIAFESLSEHPLLLRRSELAASVATALLRAQDPAAVARAVVEDVSKAVGADAIFLLEATAGERQLRLLAALGVPGDFAAEHDLISIERPGLVTLAARTQLPQTVDRIDTLPEGEYASTRKLLTVGLRSAVVLPLVVDGALVGVMGFAWRHPGRLNTLERRTLEAVRSVCALGLRYARLRSQERRETERLRTLREVAMAIEAALPLGALLQRLVAQACELTRARYGALGVLNVDGHGLADFVYTGVSAGVAEKIGHLPEGHGLLGAVIRERHPVRIPDVSADARAVGFPAHHPPMTSFLGVPLRVGHELFGNFYLCDKDGGAEFSEDDERLVELFAAQSALAVGYARQMHLAEAAHRELDRVHEELAATIAHDLRSPATAIRLQVEALLSQEGERVMVPRAVLERLGRSTDRIDRMTNDLLDVSRLELGRVALACEALSPLAAVQSLLAQMAPLLAGHPLAIEAEGEIPDVLVDPARFDQILANLLENAGKYSGAGAPVRVLVRAADDGAVVTVEDRGAGIEPDDQARLFDRFYQGPRARAHRSGLGLGLYITKGLVEAQGGRIWVDSAPGLGSRFHVWLPRAERPSEARTPAPA